MAIDLQLLNKVNKILKDSLKDFEGIDAMSEESIEVVSEEIQSFYPETPKDIAKFYILVGCTAVINDIKILNRSQMKNSLGFAELVTILEDLFIESGNQSLVPTIETSSSVFNTIYSKSDIASFGSASWGTHIEDDLKSIAKMVDKDQQQDELAPYKNLKDYFEAMGDDAKFKYDVEVDNILDFLNRTYESTYQLIKPKGIIVPSTSDQSQISMLSSKGSEGKVDYMEGTSNLFRVISKNVNDLFQLDEDIIVNTTDDTFSVKAVLESDKRVFFVRPHLKLLFGRNLFSKLGDNGNFTSPMGTRKYPTWASAEDEVRKFVERAFQNLIIYHFRNKAKSWYDIDIKDNSLEDASSNMDNINSVIELEDIILKDFQKLSSSIITSYFISEFGGTKESPSKISIRGTFKETDMTSERLFTSITQDSGKRITEEDKVEFTQRKTIQPVPLNNLVIYQFDHTFNSASANAVPLFAAKALEYINQNIQYIRSKDPNAEVNSVSWENLLVGMTKDGFIEQGQNNMQLIKNIVHYLSAGSRAGKGVASYNLILPQVLEDRLFFYADRKPDTVIVLAQQAGLNSNGTPKMAYVNGGQSNAISPENHKFIAWQEKYVKKNKPKWLDVNDQSTLDDLIYLRQGMVVLSIIDMITSKGLPQVNTELGFEPDFVKGISAVFDEYTNFQKGFLERLDPFTTSNSFLKGVLNDDIFNLIKDPESDTYKAVQKKGILKNVTMSNTWKMNLMNTLIDAQTTLAFLKNAGIQQISSIIDILVIGQGFRGENTKFVYDLQKGKNSGEYIKGETLPGLNSKTLDPFTSLLKTIPNQDYILGTPPDPENGQNYDLIDANGKNFDTYGHYLNRNYRGFTYISRTDIDNNPTNGFIFKPFLLLNEGTEPDELKAMAKSGKLDKSKMQSTITQYQNKAGGYLAYLANEVDNIKGTSWLEVRKELKDTLGLDSKGESLAGVIPYSEKIGFDSTKYNKTVEFMDAVVKRLGYSGSYHEFICDLRPEWMIGIEDIKIGVFDGIDAFQRRNSINGIRQYVQSPVFDSSKDTIDKSVLGLEAFEEEQDDDLSDFGDLNDYPEFDDTDTIDTNGTNGTPTFGFPDSDDIEEDDLDFVPQFGGLFGEVDGFTPQGHSDEPKPTPIPKPEPSQPEEPYQPEETPVKDEDKQQKSQPETTQQPKKMSAEETEYYYMGIKDAIDGNMAFNSVGKVKLNALGMAEAYETGYQTGYKTSPKRIRIQHLCATGYQEARETARIIGLDTSYQDPTSGELPILPQIEEVESIPIDKFKLRNLRDLFKDSISRHVPIGLSTKIEDTYGKLLSMDTLNSYGLKDTYVVGGTTGSITNLDVAITAPFQVQQDPKTGKYDPDKTLSDYILTVTEQIVNKVGSYGQFRDITITNNGNMIVNNMLKLNFAVPKQEYDKLPWGIKSVVDSQEWAKLFSWGELSNMPNLYSLSIDSVDFIAGFMRPFFKNEHKFLDHTTLLQEYPQLYGVTIQGEAKTRSDMRPDSYWDKFKLDGNTSQSDFRTYTSNKFDSLKNGLKSKYSKEKSIRDQMRQSRKDKYNTDFQDYIDSAPTRTERSKRKREAKVQMSKDGIKEAYKEKNFRKLVSEAGYGLRVIPGVLLARRKGR